MREKRLKKVCMTVIIAIAVLYAAAMLLFAPVKASAYDLTLNAFSSRNIKFEESARVENSAYSDWRNGLRLSGKKGSWVQVDGVMAGKFDVSYIPEKNLTGVTFTFTDNATKETFDLVTLFDEEFISSYVECQGEKIGYYYVNGALKQGTKAYSEAGVYTRVDNEYGAIDVEFDPESMQVKVNGLTVWGLHESFSDGARVGFCLDNFETYTVRMTFSAAKAGASALLYELNGNSLGGTVILGDAAPRIFADFDYDGVAGEKYTLPKINAYDLLDGLISADRCAVEVSFGNRNIEIADGSFTPQSVGEYKIVYTAENKAGKKASALYTLNVNASFGGEFEFDGRLPEAELGAHTVWRFPEVKYVNRSIDSTREIGISAEIFRDGTSVLKTETAAAGFEYAFESAGEYKIIYAPLHEYYADDMYEIGISVTDGGFWYLLDGELKQTYDTSDVIKIPTMTMKTSDGDLQAESFVRFPDGSVFANKNIKPDSAGTYDAVYTAKSGDNVYEVTLSFDVLVAPQSLFTAKGDVKMYNGAYKYNENYSGLVVETKSGGSITYNKTIDLSEYRYKTDGENSLLFELVVEPSKLFSADFLDLDFVLTDIYDPSNTVTIVLEAAAKTPTSTWSTIRAGHGTQATVGIEGFEDENNYLAGGRIHTETHGFYLNSSMNGKINSGTTHGLITVKVYFDYDNKSVYAYSEVGGRRFVVDLDHEAYFRTPWEGFTTGECTLTVTPRNYLEKTAKFILLKVDGNDFTDHSYKDTVAPKLYVDAPEGGIPNGVVGKEYPLFPATAIDGVEGAVGVKTQVYYKYKSSGLFDINVTDGKFLPEIAGEYVIDYVARDSSGNERIKSYNVTVYEENYYTENALFIEWENGYKTSADAGELVFAAGVKAVGGGAGVVNYTLSVSDESGEKQEVDERGAFRPKKAGAYTVKYALTDYIGTKKEFSYTVQVAATDGAVFFDEGITFPKAFLSSIVYELPKMSVLDFANGSAEEKQAVISVADQSGKDVPLSDGNKLAITDKTSTEAVIRYACPGRADLYKEYTVPVRWIFDDKGLIDFTSYFYGENVSVASDEENISLTASQKGASVEFLKSVSANRLQFVLGVDETKSGKFDAFSVIFTDSENSDAAVKITVNKNGDGAKATINGGNAMTMLGSFTGASNYRFTFRYKAASQIFVDVSTNTIGVARTCLNGEKFTGFPSGKVNVRIVFEDITGEVGLNLFEINGQQFKSGDDDREDFNAPDMMYGKNLGGLYALNSTVVLPSFKAADVLGNSDCFVTVKLGNKTMKDGNGNLLNEFPYYDGMSVVLAEVGDYTVTYTVKDYYITSENGFEDKYYINERQQKLPTVSVRDGEAPAVSFNGALPTSAKVGDRITLPSVTVTDNGGAEKVTVAVFYVTPNNCKEYVSEENGVYTFTVNEKGAYTVKCVAFDEYFNYAETVAVIEVN